MRFITRRLTTVLAALALAGLTVFAQTSQQTPPAATTAASAPVPCVSSLPGLSDATAMLSHIEAILNDAVGKTPVEALATQKTTNKIAIDRDKLDEIRAEITQIKVIVKK